MEKTYTEEQVKAAFWAVFHKSGEHWFDYLGDDDECGSHTKSAWRDFMDSLNSEEE